MSAEDLSFYRAQLPHPQAEMLESIQRRLAIGEPIYIKDGDQVVGQVTGIDPLTGMAEFKLDRGVIPGGSEVPSVSFDGEDAPPAGGVIEKPEGATWLKE